MLTRSLALVSIVVAVVVAAEPAAVTWDEDAKADFVALSVHGNATAAVAASGTGNATACRGFACQVAVSGTGNATCASWQCVAASGTGKAASSSGCLVVNPGFPIAVCGDAFSVSGLGESQATTVAVSVAGPATGFLALSLIGDAHGGIVALAGGDARCGWAFCIAAAPDSSEACAGTGGVDCRAVSVGPARSCEALQSAWECVAVSVLGDSDACWSSVKAYYCAALSGTGDARSNIALSGFGNATARHHATPASGIDLGGLAVSGTGNATSCSESDRCVAVSGTGEAQGRTAVSGCETLRKVGAPPPCLGP